MVNILNKNLIKNIIIILFVGFLFISIQTNAQITPEFIVSWKALNYVPAEYIGKSFPSNSTIVEAGLDLVIDNKLINLSRNNIRWNVNGKDIVDRVGAKTTTFISDNSDQLVRVIVEYNDLELDEIFTIPAQKPEVILNTRRPSRALSLGNYIFETMPFFFNISDISELFINWSINNENVPGLVGNPQFIDLNFSSEGQLQETEVLISSRVRSLLNELELGGSSINLIIK